MPTLEFTAGRLLCGTIRDALNKAKVKGIVEDFTESSGVFEREFTVRASEANLIGIRNTLQTYFDEED